MAFSKGSKRIFGVALDPADDLMSLELKQAWMMNPEKGHNDDCAFLDPYDAIVSGLKEILTSRHIEPGGKFPVPSWLTPRPELAALSLVNAQNIGEFYDSGGLQFTIKRLQKFVEKQIFPAVPVMVGVDHSATVGVISALAGKYGPEMLSVIVLDQHFDAIDASVRTAEIAGAASVSGADMIGNQSTAGVRDHLCCGNFWAYLIEEGRLLPENLSFIGVADYPMENGADTPFKRRYLSFGEKGCRFFSADRFEVEYQDPLTKFIDKAIKAPYVYISLDLDVGSYKCVLAARYMDLPGISAGNLLDTAKLIRSTCKSRKADLVGLDIMEFNMHFLGIEMEDGVRDSTLPLVGEYIQTILP